MFHFRVGSFMVNPSGLSAADFAPAKYRKQNGVAVRTPHIAYILTIPHFIVEYQFIMRCATLRGKDFECEGILSVAP